MRYTKPRTGQRKLNNIKQEAVSMFVIRLPRKEYEITVARDQHKDVKQKLYHHCKQVKGIKNCNKKGMT